MAPRRLAGILACAAFAVLAGCGGAPAGSESAAADTCPGGAPRIGGLCPGDLEIQGHDLTIYSADGSGIVVTGTSNLPRRVGQRVTIGPNFITKVRPGLGVSSYRVADCPRPTCP